MRRAWALLLWMSLLFAGTASADIAVLSGAAKDMKGPGDLNVRMDASNYAAGDLLVAQIVANDKATITPPGGWSEIRNTGHSRSGVQQRVFMWWAPAATSLPNLHVFNISGQPSGFSSTGVIYALHGVSTKIPVCGTPAGRDDSGSTMIAEQIQPPQPNATESLTGAQTCTKGSALLALFGASGPDANMRLNLENGATKGVENLAGSSGNGIAQYGAYLVLSAAGLGGRQTGAVGSPNGMNFATATIVFNADPSYVPPASGPNHIRLELTGSPLTCTPSTVTVKACNDASCSSLATTATTVSLTSTQGGWASSSLSFTGSTTTSLAVRTTTATTLGASSSPAATGATQCYLNGTQVANCQFAFADSGLLLTIPDQSSGVTSSGTSLMTVAAVRKADNAQVCVPAFANVNRSVKFWSAYTSPSSGTKTLAVNGSTVGTASPGTAVSLSFDSTGKASATLNYADAGQLTLNAQYDGSSANSDAGLTMTGSAAFVTVPYALCVDSPDANWACTAGDTSCAKFAAAGAAFNLRVTGKAAQSGQSGGTAACSLPTTPNYQQSGIVLSSAVVAPAGGAAASLSPATIAVGTGGIGINSVQTVSEVGVFNITATPPANAYFGATVPAGSGRSGRFVPAGFTVTANTLNDRADINTATTIGAAETCSSDFTYYGEAARSLFRLNAVNAQGATTLNYTGSFARLNTGVVASMGGAGLFFAAQQGSTNLNSRLTAACASGSTCGSFSAGVAAMAADLKLMRSTGSVVDAPVSASYGLVATDADGVAMFSPDFNADLSGANEGRKLGSTNLRFGRMRVEQAYGSATAALAVPAYAQYWNGTVFVKNTDDNCTPLTVPATVSMPLTTPTALYCGGGVGLYGSLAGVTARMGTVAPGGTAQLLSGDARLVLGKPAASAGYLDLALNVPDYLKFNVDNTDQTPASCTASPAVADGYLHDDNPRARIRFGTRRNSAVIYQREVY